MNLADLIRRMRAGETLSTAELAFVQGELRGILSATDTPAGVDMADMVRAATEVAAAVTAHNAVAESRDAARQALAGVSLRTEGTRVGGFQPSERSANGGSSNGAGGVQVLDRGQEDDDGRGREQQRDELVSVGRSLVLTQEFRQLAAANGNGRIQVNIPGEVRALFATTNNVVRPTRTPGYVQQNDQPLTVLDIIDRRPITTNAVEWVQETTPPNAAAEVTEGSAKPEATFVLTLKTDTTATIAHYVNITRQTLQDDLQLQGYVEGRLTYGLMKRLNGQVLNGNGTAPNLRGILNTSGLGTYTAGTAGEKAVISVRKAKTVAQLSEYEPDSVVVNPVDMEAIELTTATDGTFIVSPNVQLALQPRLWGLQVVVTTAIAGTVFGTTGGTFLVGAFREGVTLWERTGVDLFITDSHASNFTSNILTLLAEIRAALSVWRPLSIVKGTFGASRT
jgi:HK97 family phage major capsid protein